MLSLDFMTFMSDTVGEALTKVGFGIVTLIFNIIGYVYSVFNAIAGARLFNNSLVMAFTNRIYMILSIIMLFVVAYSFLSIIINPDNMSKGNTSSIKIVTNILVSLITIIIVPSVFNFAYSIQTSVVEEGVINKLILGISNINENGNDSGVFATNLFATVYSLKDPDNAPEDVKIRYAGATADSQKYMDTGVYINTYDDLKDGYISFNFVLALIVGIFVLYILIVYCFDIAVRSVKLMVYEFIAPIPALFYIVPGQEKVLKSWFKEVLKTFLELFLKLGILYLGVFLISSVFSIIEDNNVEMLKGMSQTMRNVTGIFLIMGVLMFLKRAPKIIEEIFGFKLEPGGFSLRNKLNESGLTTAFGFAGGIVASNVSNIKGAYSRLDSQYKNGEISRKKKWGSLIGGAITGAPRNTLLGAYYGARGGVKGIGTAYNTGYDTQLYKANGLRGTTIAGNLLRDNLGMQSYYEEKVKDSRIRNDAIAAPLLKRKNELQNAYAMLKRENDDKFDSSIKAGKSLDDAIKAADDYIESRVSKEDSALTHRVSVPVVANISGRPVVTYQNADLNFSQIQDMQENLVKNLMDAGISETDARRVYSTNIASYKSAMDDIKTDYYSTNISTDNTLKQHIQFMRKAADSDDVGFSYDEATSSLVHSVNIDIDPRSATYAFGSGASFYSLKDALKGVTSSLEAGKAKELVDAKTEVNGVPLSINQITNEIDSISTKVDNLSKAQKLTAESYQGLQQADEAVKRFKAAPKGGPKK